MPVKSKNFRTYAISILDKRDTDLPQPVPEVLHIAEGGQAVLLYRVVPLGVHLVTGVNILPEISTREGD